MIEFKGTTFQPVEHEVLALAAAAQDTGNWMFTDLNGINLAADPHPSDADYPEQLLWTYETVFHGPKRRVIGERNVYQNLVPELQVIGALAIGAQNIPDRVARNDMKIAQWLLRLTPATWSHWSWDKERNNRVLDRINQYEATDPTLRFHLGEARERLSRTTEPLLDEVWHGDVTEWLNNANRLSR